MAALTKEQQQGYTAILEGHNVVLTGQAGTGKSFLLKHVTKHLKSVGKRVKVLCTTGISCLQYIEHGAVTIHSWAGMYDGRYDNATLRNLVIYDDKYDKVRSNIKNCDLLLIDEISMLSKKDFDQLEIVCRAARENDFLFGGLQVVACGDFYQLPPVANPIYNDSGTFCFLSDVWKSFFTHKIDLVIIKRQKEIQLIRAVRETAKGNISPDCDRFLNALGSDIPEGDTTVHLFPKNIDAAIYSEDKLDKLEGEATVYKATKNRGPQKYLNKILAPNFLRLKKGCYIMLLRNLGGNLVNGLCGSVIAMKEDAITIYFNDIKQTHVLKRYLFTIFDNKTKVNVAERNQFPIMLAYGITIHKSQGMTLESVVVHCNGIFQPGQLSVAIGRAQSANGLQLINYKKELCLPAEQCINDFYDIHGMPFSEEANACCSKKLYEETIPSGDCNKNSDPQNIHHGGGDNDDDADDDDDLQDFDNISLDRLENVDVGLLPLLPESISPEQLINDIKINNVLTDTQTKINEICCSIEGPFLEIFLAKQFDTIQNFFPEDIQVTNTSTQTWTNILSKYHMYIVSEEYKCSVPLLYGYQTQLSEIQKYVASKLVLNMIKAMVHHFATEILTGLEPSTQHHVRKGKISESGKGKIRYVGGMCVARTKKHFSNIIKRNIGNPDQNTLQTVKTAKKTLDLLNKMEASKDDIDVVNDRSFEEIERKQNATKSLTYVNDRCFNFFLKLNDTIYRNLTSENFVLEKHNLFEYVKDQVTKDKELTDFWESICDSVKDSSVCSNVYFNIVHLYLKVCLKQFLKDTKDQLNVVKKKRHREQITIKKSAHTTFTIKDIIQDNTEGKEESHLKLKLNCLHNSKFFNTRDFTKNDLYKLCSAYDCSFSKCMKKDTLSDLLTQSIKASQSMKNSNIFSDPVASTSDQQTMCSSAKKARRSKGPYKGSGKGKGCGKKKKHFCATCDKEYHTDEEWIECSDCMQWYHRECCNISDIEWAHVQDEDVEWLCSSCKL